MSINMRFNRAMIQEPVTNSAYDCFLSGRTLDLPPAICGGGRFSGHCLFLLPPQCWPLSDKWNILQCDVKHVSNNSIFILSRLLMESISDITSFTVSPDSKTWSVKTGWYMYLHGSLITNETRPLVILPQLWSIMFQMFMTRECKTLYH